MVRVCPRSAQGAECVVVEISDGLLQRETAALLQTPRFTATVDAWVLATSDPLDAVGDVSMLRGWQIELLAVSGLISMSSLSIREVQTATGVVYLTTKHLQRGDVVAQRLKGRPQFSFSGVPSQDEAARVLKV